MKEYMVTFYWEGRKRGRRVMAYGQLDARRQVAQEYPSCLIVNVQQID